MEKKDGHSLFTSIVKTIRRMLSRKMDAIKCILKKAEDVAENFVLNRSEIESFPYYSSKFSKFNNKSSEELKENLLDFEDTYLNFTLNPDTHFYNISVDTEHSSVHVPSNIYDRGMFSFFFYKYFVFTCCI